MTVPQMRRCECTHYGRVVRLTHRECEVLTILLLRRGTPVSTTELIEAIYPNPDSEPDYGVSTIGAFLCRLRRKMPGLIETNWCWGYSIRRPALAQAA